MTNGIPDEAGLGLWIKIPAAEVRVGDYTALGRNPIVQVAPCYRVGAEIPHAYVIRYECRNGTIGQTRELNPDEECQVCRPTTDIAQ